MNNANLPGVKFPCGQQIISEEPDEELPPNFDVKTSVKAAKILGSSKLRSEKANKILGSGRLDFQAMKKSTTQMIKEQTRRRKESLEKVLSKKASMDQLLIPLREKETGTITEKLIKIAGDESLEEMRKIQVPASIERLGALGKSKSRSKLVHKFGSPALAPEKAQKILGEDEFLFRFRKEIITKKKSKGSSWSTQT
eukprot:snap_masked-scaffold_22-processed-gene-5.30-mRNA-1 protein AED:1.00 eAED:1.00 QI:0/-1/0/0/-1/1/1/0/196